MVVALLASLALHALAAAWLLSGVRPRARPAAPIEITLLTVPSTPAPAPEPKVARPPRAKPSAEQKPPLAESSPPQPPRPDSTTPKAEPQLAPPPTHVTPSARSPAEPPRAASVAELNAVTPSNAQALTPNADASSPARTGPASVADASPATPSPPPSTQHGPRRPPPSSTPPPPAVPHPAPSSAQAHATTTPQTLPENRSRVPRPLPSPIVEGHLATAPPPTHRTRDEARAMAQSNPGRTSTPAPTNGVGDAPRAAELSVAPRLRHELDGTLIVNHGEDPEAEAAVRIEAQREAEAQVRTWAAEDIGHARVMTGGVDSYFAMMRRTLEANAAKAPPFQLTHAVAEFLHAYQTGAAQYGANGSVDSGESQNDELRSLERRLSGPPLSPGSRAEQIARGLGGTKVFLNEANQVGVGMVALIEIHQDRSGNLLGVRLVRTSGSKTFDRYALATVPKAVEQLQPPSLSARGTSPDGIHTLWAYRGEITYLRAAKTLTAKDIPYLLSAGALSALAGDFDLATGQLDVADFRHPRYLCKVSLVAVY